jgi:peptidoglycan/LPS O-acetylase OafA/YrhL
VLAIMTLVILYRLEDTLRVYGLNWQGALHGSLRNDHHTWLPPSFDLVRDWVFCGIAGLAVPFFSDITSHWLNAITKRIAQYSYGVYVCHVPMLWLCFDRLHLGNAAVSAILTIILSALVSFALYHLIEHPAIQLGKHLSTRLVNGPALA